MLQLALALSIHVVQGVCDAGCLRCPRGCIVQFGVEDWAGSSWLVICYSLHKRLKPIASSAAAEQNLLFILLSFHIQS